MKIKLKKEAEYDIKTLHVRAGVRYFEDTTVNGQTDDEGDLIPCRDGSDNWCPIIDIDTGIITNWEQGKGADVHYKICDDGSYTLKNNEGNVITYVDGYVPKCMCPEENGYGDYIIMKIDANGLIAGWKFSLEGFENDES
jgi:hypothetical protein